MKYKTIVYLQFIIDVNANIVSKFWVSRCSATIKTQSYATDLYLVQFFICCVFANMQIFDAHLACSTKNPF